MTQAREAHGHRRKAVTNRVAPHSKLRAREIAEKSEFQGGA